MDKKIDVLQTLEYSVAVLLGRQVALVQNGTYPG